MVHPPDSPASRSALLLVVCRLAALLLALATVPSQAQDTRRPPAVSLHVAALRDDVEAIRQHATAGSDLDQLDAYGATPLIVATTFGRAAAARALIEAGADLTIANPQGATPLHVGAFLGRRDIVELLLESGADRDRRDDDGNSAHDLAAIPVEHDRPAIDQLRSGLGFFGLELDTARIAAARPRIVELLRRTPEQLRGVDFTPTPGRRWPVSTPAAQGLDPTRVAAMYADAAALKAIRGLLIVKNGHLVAERYFNEGAIDRPTNVQSVTKSVTSALVGIAFERGCLRDIDAPMLEYFPERAADVRDARKRSITVRHLLQMRAGYGNEGADSARWAGLIGGHYLPLMIDFPLDRDPGTGFDYSNLTSHLLGVIVARACETDLLSFAAQHLFGPIGARPGEWLSDPDGYRYGYAGLRLTARDMAGFGLLFLNDGAWEGRQVLPADWVDASLTNYSSTLNTAVLPTGNAGRYFRDAKYGYQWWSAAVDGRRFDFAWGYGGQLVVLLHDLDMVIAVTTDPFDRQTQRVYEARKDEQATFNLIGKFIQSLPAPDAGS